MASPHILRWEIASCTKNHYIATEYVSNGSLHQYMHKAHAIYSKSMSRRYIEKGLALPGNLSLGMEIGLAIMRKVGIPVFRGILRGLAYMHGQNICHLDLDMYNIAVAEGLQAKIIDFGSSQIMDGRGFVGGGREAAAIKAKPTYRSPELKQNARERMLYNKYCAGRACNDNNHREEQLLIPKGFHGAKSDMYSAGVVVRHLDLFLHRVHSC
jgi:5'-AMP-activated protein kinase catalytic alpha subunit